ncbi:MAG TPA: 1-phosphofructokinase [Longimicrobiaceae bacterium]
MRRPLEVVTVTPNPAIDWTVDVPGFTAGAVNRVAGQRSRAAGKGVNVAAALADHGLAVAATGFLGRGNAAPFEALFARKGIADRFVRVAGETRVGIKIVDPEKRETTDVNFPGPEVAPEEVRSLLERVAELSSVDPGPWFVLAGSLPPGVEATLYRDLVRALREAGCRTVLDASGEALRDALDAAPGVVKPNVHELEALLGRSLPTVEAVVEAARLLLARGVGLAVVSMGAEGALFVREDAVVQAVPPGVEVRSTVGAGDAMVAGIVAGELAGLPLAETARLATAFSLAALTGADAGALMEGIGLRHIV